MGQLVFQATLGGAVNLIGPNIAGTVNFTLPSADGTSGQALATNGSGTLAFSSFATLVSNTFSGSQTLSAGTANGVTYLNGSKVVTSGSALTFDGTTLGVGVAGSAWDTLKAVDLGSGGTVWGTAAQVGLGSNVYYGAGGFRYKATNVAAALQIDGNIFKWFTAASGTAGNAITFTQAMTLDASGNLGVGTTSPSYPISIERASQSTLEIKSTSTTGESRIYFSDTTAGIGAIEYQHNGDFMRFYTNNAERARIDSSGNLLVGTSSNNGRLCVQGATANSSANALYVTSSSGSQMFLVRNDGALRSESTYYITTASAGNLNIDTSGYIARSTSSLKYKNNVQDATHGLAKVLALRPVTYKGNNNGDTVFGGLIAEEVHEAGLTEFVQYADDGSPDALAYGNMVSLAFKAIQEQQALITQLQADVATLKGN